MKSEEFITSDFNKKKGTYAGLHFDKETIERLLEYSKRNHVPKALAADEYHSTLLYSRKYLPEYEPQGKLDNSMLATPLALEIWESPANAFKDNDTNCLILKYECQDQVDRFNELMDAHDATYDYDEYKPHTTLSYDVGDLSLEDLEDVSTIGDLTLVDEYSEELNLDKTYEK